LSVTDDELPTARPYYAATGQRGATQPRMRYSAWFKVGAATRSLAHWLNTIGLGQYAQHFVENSIDAGSRPHDRPMVPCRYPVRGSPYELV
jgi:hypothetical protein